MARLRIPKYVVLHKKRGETPLQCIDAWRLKNPAFEDVPASYAGRLDPMAEGSLLVLLGPECRRQKEYTKLDKEYEIEVLLDLGTDTGDTLGLPDYAGTETEVSRGALVTAIKKMEGTHSVPYPIYSSKTVNGKPLFLYALEKTLDTIEIPRHDETIYRISNIEISTLSSGEVEKNIVDGLSFVPRSDEPSKALGADFRQDVIRAGWKLLLESIDERTFVVIRMRVTCGTGTYMRTLAERIGAELETMGLVLSIKRTKIGTFKKFLGIPFWSKRYA